MVIATGQQEPTLEEAERFLAAWPARLERGLHWFEKESVGRLILDGSTASLHPAATWVLARLGLDAPVEVTPDWFTPGLAKRGWTGSGAALAEGLMAYVSRIYADHLEMALPWILDRDPKSAYYLKPVVDAVAIAPPWRQVLGSLRMAQGTGQDPALRTAVEHSIEHYDRVAGEQTTAAPGNPEPGRDG